MKNFSVIKQKTNAPAEKNRFDSLHTAAMPEPVSGPVDDSALRIRNPMHNLQPLRVPEHPRVAQAAVMTGPGVTVQLDSPINMTQLGRLVGRGGFGSVYAMPNGSDMIAVKQMDKTKAAKYARQEISVLRRSQSSTENNENIIRFHGSAECPESLYIGLEYIDGRDLFDEVKGRYPNGMPVEHFKRLARGMAEGLHFLHRHNVVHRDLKPENIMLRHNTVPVIVDFGLAKIMPGPWGRMKTICGTPEYASPDLWRLRHEGGYGKETDDWSLGIVFFIMLTARQLFAESNAGRVRRKIVDYSEGGAMDAHEAINSVASPEQSALLQSLLCWPPEARLKSLNANGDSEILAHSGLIPERPSAPSPSIAVQTRLSASLAESERASESLSVPTSSAKGYLV